MHADDPIRIGVKMSATIMSDRESDLKMPNGTIVNAWTHLLVGRKNPLRSSANPSPGSLEPAKNCSGDVGQSHWGQNDDTLMHAKRNRH